MQLKETRDSKKDGFVHSASAEYWPHLHRLCLCVFVTDVTSDLFWTWRHKRLRVILFNLCQHSYVTHYPHKSLHCLLCLAMLSQNIVDIYKMHRLKFSDANSGTWHTQETQQGSVASAPGPRQQQRNTKSTRRQHLTRCAGCVASFSPLSTSLTHWWELF